MPKRMANLLQSTILAAFLAAPIILIHAELSSTVQSPTTSSSETASPLSRSYSFYDQPDYREPSRTGFYGNTDRRQDPTTKPLTITSNSYSVQGGGNNGGSAVYVDTMPLPITFTRYPSTTERAGQYESMWRYQNRNANSRPVNNIQDKLIAPTNCNGVNCDDDDLNRSYYSVLNGKYGGHPKGEPSFNRRYGDTGSDNDNTQLIYNRRYGDAGGDESTQVIYNRYATFPFNVRGIGPEEYDFPKRRVTRTSTTSTTTNPPNGWLQLSPKSSSRRPYDPFFSKGDAGETDGKFSGEMTSSSKFSGEKTSKFENRIGVELNPDSFAARWGWGQKAGTRLPDWLEKLNEEYANSANVGDIHSAIRRPGPTRDDDPKNWVKLDPIPVSGVSISKWVPKGTPAADLPTTGNNVRNKPHAWWDGPPSTPVVKRPTYGIKNSNNMGWGSNDYDSLYNKRKPGNAWQDIIYPDTPGSATASWETTSDILKGSSQRFPSMSSSGWKADGLRGPVASWTAPASTNRNYIRRPSNNNYPDLQSGDDDPRWVLISNSRHGTPSKNNLPHHRYRPNPDRWRLEMPDRIDTVDHDYEPNDGPPSNQHHHQHRRRTAKDVKYLDNPTAERSAQDEAFERVNFTLQNLKPVLQFDTDNNGRSIRPTSLNKTRTTTTAATTTARTTTTTKKPKVSQAVAQDVFIQPPRRKSLLSALIGDGRQVSGRPTGVGDATNNGTKVVVRKGNSMKPVLAAVGAGMIPAAMAAAIPIMMGRKKRSTDEMEFERAHHVNIIPSHHHRSLVKNPYKATPRKPPNSS